MRRLKLVSVFVLLGAILVPLIATGCGGPSERAAVASSSYETSQVADGTVSIDHVNMVQSGNMWKVVARIKNNNANYCLTNAMYSATLFDSISVVLGNDTARLPTIYPSQASWIVSAGMLVGDRVPDRADFRITSIAWKQTGIEDIPALFMIQSNYIPTQATDAKVTGILHYSGKMRNAQIGVTGVLVDARENPVDATSMVLENVSTGEYPFEIPFLRAGAPAPEFAKLEVTGFILPR